MNGLSIKDLKFTSKTLCGQYNIAESATVEASFDVCHHTLQILFS